MAFGWFTMNYPQAIPDKSRLFLSLKVKNCSNNKI